MKDELKELLEKIASADEDGMEIEVHKFDPLEASPVEDLFDEDYVYESLIFEAGITEAVRRLLKNHKDYDLIDYVRTILNAPYEGDKE